MVIFTETYFNSRPHGGRQHFVLTPVSPLIFQLTPSRRATATYIVILYLAYFNSRPHGGRRCLRVVLRLLAYFNSRPHGGRQLRPTHFLWLLPISTHALTEGDGSSQINLVKFDHFNSRPHGGRRSDRACNTAHHNFNSRPHGGRLEPHPLLRTSNHFNSRPHGGRRM